VKIDIKFAVYPVLSEREVAVRCESEEDSAFSVKGGEYVSDDFRGEG
jgi:hypothetical protein